MAVSKLSGTALAALQAMSTWNGGIRQRYLAEVTGVRSGWTRRMARLQALGLVERHGGRVRHWLRYTITDAGRKVLADRVVATEPVTTGAVQQGNNEARAEFAKPVKALVSAPVLVDDSVSPGIESVYTQGWVAASWVVN